MAHSIEMVFQIGNDPKKYVSLFVLIMGFINITGGGHPSPLMSLGLERDCVSYSSTMSAGVRHKEWLEHQWRIQEPVANLDIDAFSIIQ